MGCFVGDDEWAVCRKYLQATGMVISAGVISKAMKPDDKLEIVFKKIPYYNKIKNAYILYQVVKEEAKNIFLTPYFMQCLGVINSKSLMDIDDYTKQMIGTTSDDFIFE